MREPLFGRRRRPHPDPDPGRGSSPGLEPTRLTDDLEVLLATEHLRVTALGDPDQPNLFLCCTGVNQNMGGIGAEEFVGSTRLPGFSALFVSDLTRSWFNAFAPSLLVNAVAERVEGRRVVAVGNSMGGYGAIWSSGHLEVDTVIAFAPQYSVHPEVVPTETRWADYRAAISSWRDRSLEGYFNDTTRYFTINGDADEIHWSRFPESPNCSHLLLEESGHGPAALLKAHDALNDTIVACLAGSSPLESIRSHGLGARTL